MGFGAVVAAGLLAAPITYQCQATAAPAVLAALSKLSGIHLRAKDGAANEILFLRVHDEPLEKLMPEIAKATSCRWEPSADGYTLKPDLALWRKQEAAELDQRAGVIRESLKADLRGVEKSEAEEVVGLSKPPETDWTDHNLMELEGGPWFAEHERYHPLRNLLIRLLGNLNPRELVSIPDNRRLTWASEALTEFQKRLPPASANAFRKFQEDETRIHVYVERETRRAWAAGKRPKNIDEKESWRFPESLQKPGDKVILTVSRYGDGGSADLRLFANDGKCLESTGWQFPDLAAKTLPKEDLPEPKFSEDSLEILKMYAQVRYPRSEPNGIQTLPPELRRKFTRFTEFDPLATIASDLLASYTHDAPQVVASVPDRLLADYLLERNVFYRYQPHFLSQDQKPSAEDPRQELDILKDGDFLVVRPSSPAQNRALRMDRRAAEALFSCDDNEGWPPLSRLCGYATRPSAFAFHSLDWQYLDILCPPDLPNDLLAESLRFLGALTPRQLSVLRSGKRVAFTDLDDSQVALLMPFVERRFEIDFGGPPDLPGEPSEFLSSAWAAGSLGLAIDSDPVAYRDDLGNPDIDRQPLSGTDVVFWQTRSRQKLPATWKLGRKDVYTLNIALAPHLDTNLIFTDTVMPKDATPTNLDLFPAKFIEDMKKRKLLEAARAAKAAQPSVQP